MATAIKNLSADERVAWYEKHLFNPKGGIKKRLSEDKKNELLDGLADARLEQLQEKV